MLDRDETFNDYNISVDIGGANMQRTICPECEHTHKTRGQKDLSVNMQNETWFCHRCGFKGHLKKANYNKYNNNYNNINKTNIGDKEIIQNNVNNESKVTYRDMTEDYNKLQPLNENCLNYLLKRGITEDTAVLSGLKTCKVYSHKAGMWCEAIAFPVFKDCKVVNVHSRTIEQKDFIQAKGGNQNCCFNQDSLKNADIIFITEGQMDTLSFLECGYQSVISVPNGAPPVGAKSLDNKLSWIDENMEHFEKASKIILAMDKDEPGIAFEKIVAEKIGIAKCYTVDYFDGCKDGNDVLVKFGKEKLIECVEKRCKPFPVAGIVTFNDYSKDIIDYYIDKGQSNLYKTGLQNLDDKFGLLTSTLNILTGVPSHGKSEFMYQIIINTINLHKWKWAIYTPENFPVKLYFQKLSEKLLKKPFFEIIGSDYTIPKMTVNEVANAVKLLSDNIKLLTAGNDSGDDLDGILRRVELCIRRDGIKAFIIDPWNEVEHLRPKGLSETEYISQALTKLRNFARRFDVMCWIIAHPAKLTKNKDGKYPVPTPYDISGSAHWRNKADCCFCFWRDTEKDTDECSLYVQKVRNKVQGRANYNVDFKWHRTTGILTPIGYDINGHRYSFKDC